MATALLLTAALLLWYQLVRDESEQFPSGFTWPDPVSTIPDHENGLIQLITQKEKRSWPEVTSDQKEILMGRMPWDTEMMQPLVDVSEEMRQLMDEALKAPYWQDQMIGESLVYYVRMIPVTDILLARALERSRTGHTMEALEWVAVTKEAVGRCQASAQTLASLIICSSHESIIDRTLMHILAQGDDSDAALVKGLSILGRPIILEEMLWRTVAEENRSYKKSCPEGRKHPDWPPAKLLGFHLGKDPPQWLANSRYKPQATFNLTARLLDKFIRLGFREEPEARGELNALREWLDVESKLSLWSFDPNRSGRVLAAYDFLSLSNIEKNTMSREGAHRCCLVAIAARRWSLAHGGEQPEALTDLIPDYLHEVPRDPESGQYLQWDAILGVVYCPRADDGGIPPIVPEGEIFMWGEDGTAARFPY